jgi:hypothetical protein
VFSRSARVRGARHVQQLDDPKPRPPRERGADHVRSTGVRCRPSPAPRVRWSRACRAAILVAATGGYNPVYATTSSGGRPRPLAAGVAPILAKLVYLRHGGYEVRQAKVSCRVGADGRGVSIS